MHSVYKDCVYVLSLWNHVNVSLKISAPFWLTVILNLSCSAFLTATFPAIAQACVWVSVSSLHLFLWHFTSFFSHTCLSSNIQQNICQPHVSLFLVVTCTHVLVEAGSSFFRKLNYFLQWFWRALSMTISCDMFYLTAILWIADHFNKLKPAWKTY